MPQKNERTIPVTVTGEAEEDLKKIIARSGIRQADILRYINIAALRALVKEDYIAFPIELEVRNGKKPK